MDTITESIYDHPRYYDLVFGADCAAELKFIGDVNRKYLNGKASRLFEPACGTGRLLLQLTNRGFNVEGIDLNPKAIEFCNQRFKRNGRDAPAWVADMTNFQVGHSWDLAFNTINSFRHLTTAQSAIDHLACMAAHSNSNGLYLVGIHLTPTTGEPPDSESWSAKRGQLAVTTQMWTIERNPQRRLERFGMRFDITTPNRRFRIEDELRMRTYTFSQFSSLIKRSGCWEIIDMYDFGYEIERPIRPDPSSEDVVFVLRKIDG